MCVVSRYKIKEIITRVNEAAVVTDLSAKFSPQKYTVYLLAKFLENWFSGRFWGDVQSPPRKRAEGEEYGKLYIYLFREQFPTIAIFSVYFFLSVSHVHHDHWRHLFILYGICMQFCPTRFNWVKHSTASITNSSINKLSSYYCIRVFRISKRLESSLQRLRHKRHS